MLAYYWNKFSDPKPLNERRLQEESMIFKLALVSKCQGVDVKDDSV